MSAPNTLGLDDDLDSVELVIEIEQAFDVKISNHEAAGIMTMGDLHDLIASKLDGLAGGKCQTSMAFYRIRRALKRMLGDADIRPDTALREIWSGAPKSLFKRVERHCELRLASLSSTDISGIGGLLMVAAMIGTPILLVAKVSGWLTLALAGALFFGGFMLIRLDPLAFGTMVTVGDLARRTATQNYGALAKAGGRSNNGAIWDALAEIASAFAVDLEAGDVERGTILLQSQFEKTRGRI